MYNKLFTKILDSSIWMEPSPTRIVWLTFIAAMDETGFVQFASIHNVAHRAVVSLEEAATALKCLESPDPNSADPANEGRRIERVEGGWIVLNSEKYRAIATREHQKELNRERVKRYRETLRGNGEVMGRNESVTPSEAHTDTHTNPLPPKENRKKQIGRVSCPDTDSARRLAAVFKRRDGTMWSQLESEKLALLEPIHPEDLVLIERYFEKHGKETPCYLRHDLVTLLNNWNTEVDRARKHLASKPKNTSCIN